MPQGLWGWYHRFWHTWARDHATDWRATYLPLLAALAAARESATLPELCDFAEVPIPPPELPAEWRPYLTSSRNRPRRYRLLHASLVEYLHGRGTTEDSAEQDFADDLAYATQTVHARLADRCLAATEPDDYALKHLAAHLRLAERPDELFALVDDPAWRTAHLLHDPTGGGFLGNVTEAWGCAVELDRRALEAGSPPPHLQREIAYALAAEDVRTFAAHLPPELLGRLVAARLWTPEQALASAGLSPFPYGRAQSLAAVMPHLSGSQRVAELQAFFAWADDDRERALGVLAEHVPPSMMGAALRFAAEVDDSSDRARALVQLLPYLQPGLLTEAVEIAGDIHEAAYRVEALSALVPHLDGELREAAVASALEALVAADRVVGASWIGKLFVGLAAEAPDRLLAIAGRLGRSGARAHAVVVLAPHLDPAEATRALADAITPDSDVLSTLSAALPPELLPAAAAAADAIEDADDRARALVTLTSRLPLERQAVDALSGVRNADTLAMLIVELGPVLDDTHLAGALQAAMTLDDATKRGWVLGQLYPHLPPDLQHLARSAAEAIDTPWVRERALDKMALGPWEHDDADHDEGEDDDRTPEELAQALADAASDDDIYSRADALKEVTPELPDDMLLDAVRAAAAPLNLAERAELWAMLAERPAQPAVEPSPPPLAVEERAGALAEVLAIEDVYERVNALATLCQRIPVGERPRELNAALAETLDTAAATLGSGGLSRAVRRLAPQLPEERLPHAFAIASRIRRTRRRKYALQDMSADLQTATPTVLHVCLGVVLRASVERLEATESVRWVLPIVRALKQGGVRWRPS